MVSGSSIQDFSDVLPRKRKVCCFCRKKRLLTNFNKRSAAKDGLQSSCKFCARERALIWAIKNKKRHAERSRRWEYHNPERIAAMARKRRGQVNSPTRKQPKLCECCKRPNKLVEDHNHQTGLFRGWLCGSCNRGIGLLTDSVKGVEQAVLYLRKYDQC